MLSVFSMYWSWGALRVPGVGGTSRCFRAMGSVEVKRRKAKCPCRLRRWQHMVLTKAWGRWNCPGITVARKGPRPEKRQREKRPWDQNWEGACRVCEGAAAEVRWGGKKSDTGDKPEKCKPHTVQVRAQRGRSCGRSVSKQSENFQ